MTTKDKLQEMMNKQEDFKNRIEEERDLENKDMDCVKAIMHELVEYEHGERWKWWKDGSDVHKHLEEHHVEYPENDDLSDETIRNYKQEEIADIWHFVLQEVIMEENLQLGVDEMADLFEDPACHEIEMEDKVKALRNVLTMYETHKLMGQERHMNIHFGSVVQILICLTIQEGMGIDELHTQCMDKNEENHERQDGESSRGEEYASE